MMNITVSTTVRTVVEFATGTLTIWHASELVAARALESLSFWISKQGENNLADYARDLTASALKASASWQCCASGKIATCTCVKAWA